MPEKKKLIEWSSDMLKSREVSYENLVGVGIGLFQQKECELSNELFAHALKMYPKELSTHVYYAITNFHLGNYEQARKHAQIADESGEQANSDNPTFFINDIAECYMRLGESYVLLKKYELALRNIHKAMEIGGPSSGFFSSLAGAYLLKGDKAEAIKYYKKAIEIDSSNKLIQEKLSKLQSDRTN